MSTKTKFNIDQSWKENTERTSLPEGMTYYSNEEINAEGFKVRGTVRLKKTYYRNEAGELTDAKGKKLPKGADKVLKPESEWRKCLYIYQVDKDGNAEFYTSANLSAKMAETYDKGDVLKAADFGVMYYEEGTELPNGNTVSADFMQITRPGGSINDWVE